jgi:hypothetical protein
VLSGVVVTLRDGEVVVLVKAGVGVVTKDGNGMDP